MKHNKMVRVAGEWWVVEIDKAGNKWAVNGLIRKPYGELFAGLKADINAVHPRRGELLQWK